jgi:hypothetical protein
VQKGTVKSIASPEGTAAAAPAGHAPAAGAAESGFAPVIADLRRHVLEHWPRYYPARAHAGAPELRLETRHFGFSVLFSAALVFPRDAGTERFMIKVRRKHRDGTILPDEVTDRTRTLARTEHEQHVRAYEFFAARGDDLGVVRPLDYIDRYNAFLVDHAVGKDLSKVVRDDDDIALASIERCGRWWRAFHRDLHHAQDRAWNPETIDRGLERRLGRLGAIGAPPEVAGQLADEMRAAARAVAPTPVPVSLIHGDCKLRHVWGSATGIQVLDFGNTKIGDSWIDPAALVAELSLYSLWSRHLHTESHVPHIRTLCDAYFGGPPPPAFWLYVADTLFKKWHRRLRKWGPGSGMTRMRQSLKTVRLDRTVERLYIDRWFSAQIRSWLALAGGQPPEWLQPLAK